MTCLSHKAWETELCFEVCSASFKQLEKVSESRIGEDETPLTSSSHLTSTVKPELTNKPLCPVLLLTLLCLPRSDPKYSLVALSLLVLF